MKLTAAKCPSCGANIKVDRSLKLTKCEYCNSEIVVEDAIENLIQVELKDTPTLDNYLKLGNRYYENKEYAEAYKAYSKAEEIDPDNPLVVLRKGLSRSMVTDYNNFDVVSAINGLKESLDLMKRMSFSRKDINKSVDECGEVLYVSRNYLMEVYQNNKLTKAQTTGYIERLESCLKGFIYLDSVVDGDRDLEKKIVYTIMETIDVILGNENNSKYHLSSNYVSELKNTRKKYEDRFGNPAMDHRIIAKHEKVVDVENKASKLKDILCYIMVIVLLFCLLGAIITKDSWIGIVAWLLAAISFIPAIKKFFVKKYGSNVGKLFVFLRIFFVIIAIIILGSGPIEFENTFHGDNNIKITFKSGKFTMETNQGIIKGEYHWDTKDNDYYIHVQGDNNENYEYRYRNTSDGGSLCLLKKNKCTETYLSVD